MSVAPVMPVVTGTKTDAQLLVVRSGARRRPGRAGPWWRRRRGVAAPPVGGLPPLSARIFSLAGSRWTSAWMGMVRTFGLCAVVIFAVAERPGRRSSGGLVEGDDDLEVLGLFGAGGALAWWRGRWCGAGPGRRPR